MSYQVILRADGRQEALFQHTLTPTEMPTKIWRPVLVDLGPWSGREVEIILKTSVEQEDHQLRGLPVWANPEIVTPRASAPTNVVLISIDTLRPTACRSMATAENHAKYQRLGQALRRRVPKYRFTGSLDFTVAHFHADRPQHISSRCQSR